MKNATFRQMVVFEAVARHLNYSRAAEELRLSQPGVSIHVKQLEQHAGLALFEQLGKRIYLTPAGQQMLHYSRAIIQQFKEAEEALAALKGIRGGLLNIAVISAGDYFFTGLLAEFCRRYENVTVQLNVSNREEIVHQLVENTTDLAVLLRPPASPDMIAEAFAPQPHVIIAAPRHALARKRHISLQALANEAFIVRERGSDTRLAMEEVLAEFRVKFNIAMEIKSTETIKQAVIAGMGISFLSAHTIGRDLEAGRLAVLDVEGFPVMRKWHIVHRKNKRLPAVAVAFKEFLLQEGAALIERLVGRVAPRRKSRA
ncbi:MAG: LysR family transcriptional regulator [Betaproteobacteria bacterium]|nr:LysR family transcriptional regulator [Betaproteobacteria bacterium]